MGRWIIILKLTNSKGGILLKLKKIISALLVYVFVLTMLPLTAIALNAPTDVWVELDNLDLPISNKYDMQGEIIKAVQYDDFKVVLINDKNVSPRVSFLHIIKDGTSTKYALPNLPTNFDSYGYLGRTGNTLYLISSNKKQLRLNVDTGVITTSDISGLVSNSTNHAFYAGTIDSAGNKWIEDFDSANYNLLKVDIQGTATSYNLQIPAMRDLSADANNNIWLNKSGILSKFSTQSQTIQDLYSPGTGDSLSSYKVATNGDVWLTKSHYIWVYPNPAVYGYSVLHLTNSGTLIKEYIQTSDGNLDIDKSGNIWLLQGNNINKLVNDTFIKIYDFVIGANFLSVNTDKKMIVYGYYSLVDIDSITPVIAPTPKPTPTPAPAYPNQLIQNGANGQAVNNVQDKLKSLGFNPGPLDGQFGPQTLAAVKNAQAALGLIPDGIIGPLTWGKLFGFNVGVYSTPVTQGSNSVTKVGGIQDKLISLGFKPGKIDGLFGPQTLAAIKAFQKAYNLLVDGIIGPNTWQKLFG